MHLIVDASGVQMVEGALEFGGEFSFDIGVASGGVHVMAGIYFKLSGTTTIVAGFVDIGGEVSVLGIISISIDLNLSLAFEADGPKNYIKGKATLTISIHIIFFSIGVSVSVEKSFAANPGDPRIGAHMSFIDRGADHFGILEGVSVALASFGQPRHQIGDRRDAGGWIDIFFRQTDAFAHPGEVADLHASS